jgi:transcriptional regulator NrdR family protein
MTYCFMMTILLLDILNHSCVKDKLPPSIVRETMKRPMKYENIEQQWAQIQNKMLSNGFEQVHEFNSAYGESSFETICYLTQMNMMCLACEG